MYWMRIVLISVVYIAYIWCCMRRGMVSNALQLGIFKLEFLSYHLVPFSLYPYANEYPN